MCLGYCIYHSSEAESGDLLYPGFVVGHPHVDPGQVGVGALDAVAHGPHQQPPPVLLLPHQRPAAVPLHIQDIIQCSEYLLLPHLARVLLAILVAGAEEGVPDGLLVAGGVEHLLAAEVVDDGHGDLVQDVGDAAACTGGVNIVSCEWMNAVQCTLSRDPAKYESEVETLKSFDKTKIAVLRSHIVLE